MTFAQRTYSVFVKPNVNLHDANDPDLRTFVNLDKTALQRRWEDPEGRRILHTLRGNRFAREVISANVGMIYGKYDLRGIPLSGIELKAVDLSDCDFFASDLRKANFSMSNMEGSYLSECNLEGAVFDWCKMDGVLLDNVKYDYDTSFTGVDLNQVNFTLAALLREAALSQQLIQDLEQNHKLFAWVLRVTSNYGRSFTRFALWCIGIVVVFTLAYWLLPYVLKEPVLSQQGPWNGLYFSVMAFATLGFAEIQPVHLAGKLLVVTEVIAGYFMLGLLIAILGRKVLR